MGGGGSQPSSQTVTQVQQVPEYQQQFSQENQDIARAIGSTPYQQYQGQLIAGMTPDQQQGMQMAKTAATSYQPDLSAAEGLTAAGSQQWNPMTAMQYMSPYVMSSLAPQMQQLQLQLGQQQNANNANATQAGAFGDARHGVSESMNNFYGDLAMNDLVSQGLNTAYNTGQQAFQTDQSRLLGAGSQFANLGEQQQGLGETGSNAVFNAGSQQQALTQQQLTEAYNNFMNQVNYPQSMLALRESAISNNPAGATAGQVNLAPNNSTAQSVGSFSALSGALSNMLNSGSKNNG